MLQKIWEPLEIRKLTIPNRIIMGSMHLGIEGSENGIEKITAFYVERAKGNVGLMVTGGIAVNLEGAGGHHFLYLHEDQAIKNLTPLTEAVHEAGGRIAAQLFHAGRYSDKRGTGLDPVAPSPIQAPINVTAPRELTHEEILQTIDEFAQAARRAKLAGFDAVEIMGSEGYLINQFLSPVTNHRADDWGGSFKKRIRFGIEIVRKVREAVGEEFPILFRISGLDLIPNSTTLEETVVFAGELEKAGADILNVGIGWHESKVPTIAMFVPRASYTWVADKIRQNVSIPVVTSNRINKLELAEEILHREQADLISMARPFLADPYLLIKAKEGHLDDIRTCTACNQGCLDHVFSGMPVSCVVNPNVGREHLEDWKIKPIQTEQEKKKIAVIGAGPAGLEVSRVLAERGFSVSLIEQNSYIGGQLYFANMIPGKEEWNETIKYYRYQLDKLGVDLRLNKKAIADGLHKEKFDHYIIATGSSMKKPDIPGIDSSNVVSYSDVFNRKVTVGRNIVFIGAGGIAVDLSHFLKEETISTETIKYLMEYQILSLNEVQSLMNKGRNVTIMRRKGKVGANLGITTRWAVLQRLQQQGVNMLTGVEYKEITENGVWIKYKNDEKFLPADTVILATGQEVNNHLYIELMEMGLPVSVIGGAKEAGELDAKKAIYEGAELGRII